MAKVFKTERSEVEACGESAPNVCEFGCVGCVARQALGGK